MEKWELEASDLSGEVRVEGDGRWVREIVEITTIELEHIPNFDYPTIRLISSNLIPVDIDHLNNEEITATAIVFGSFEDMYLPIWEKS